MRATVLEVVGSMMESMLSSLSRTSSAGEGVSDCARALAAFRHASRQRKKRPMGGLCFVVIKVTALLEGKLRPRAGSASCNRTPASRTEEDCKTIRKERRIQRQNY